MKVLDILSTVGALVLAATPLAVAGAAYAEPAAPVAIQVGDLDFANRADVARFEARVVKAADRLCDASPSDLARRSVCVSAVRDEAMDKLSGAQRGQLIAAGHKVSPWSVASAQ